ncbi:Type III secretion system effector HopBA1 [Pseudomonas fluorescens]
MNPVGPVNHVFRQPAIAAQSVSTPKASPVVSKVVVPQFPVDRSGHINMPAQEILASLCAKNEVTYLADTHGKLGIPAFVSGAASKLKEAGVEMAGVEFVKYSENAAFQAALSHGEGALQDFLNKDWGKHGYEWTGRVAKAICDLKTAGIKVVGIDRAVAGPAPTNLRESLAYMRKRLALNGAWDMALVRELSSASMSKAIVWGGATHFRTGDANGPSDMRPGPVMGFAFEGEKDALALGQSRMRSLDNKPLIETTLANS